MHGIRIKVLEGISKCFIVHVWSPTLDQLETEISVADSLKQNIVCTVSPK
jgi:hypothetical protein